MGLGRSRLLRDTLRRIIVEVGFVGEDVGISWTSCGLISFDGLVGNSSIRQDFNDSGCKLKFWSNHSYPHAHSHTHTRFMPSFDYSSFNLGVSGKGPKF